MEYAEFGELLHQRRTEAGLSLRHLSARADVNQGTISHAEGGSQTRRLSADSASRLDAALAAEGAIMQAWRRLPAPSSSRPDLAVPHQLPPAGALFGRDELLGDLVERANTPVTTSTPATAPTVILLTGAGGIGKTALAVTAAHQLSNHWGVGALWCDLRGWHETFGARPTGDVLERWCRALGASTHDTAGDYDDLVALWRMLTSGRRILAVLDNVRPDQTVEDLLPASPQSLLFITSRDRMLGTTAPVHRIQVPPLDHDASLGVLSAYSGHPAHVLDPLAVQCAGLPLALRIVGEDAGAHYMSEEVPAMASSFGDMPYSDAVVRIAKGCYEQLDADTARTWRLLAHVGEPGVELTAASLGITTKEAHKRLKALVSANLLDRARPDDRAPAADDRFLAFCTFHDLLRTAALQLSWEVDDPGEINNAVRRALLWLLHSVANADAWFAADGDSPVSIPLPADIMPATFASQDEAQVWLDVRFQYLLPAVQSAVRRNWPDLAWQLAAAPAHWAFLNTPWESWTQICQAAEGTAREAGDHEGQAWMQYNLGSMMGDQERYTEAIYYTDHSLTLRRPLGNNRDTGWSAVDSARWRIGLDKPDEEILPLIDEAIAAHGTVGLPGVALGWTFRAQLARRRGDVEAAQSHLQQALSCHQALTVPGVYCYVYAELAGVELDVGHLFQARNSAQRLDERARDVDSDWFRITAQAVIADTYTGNDERDQRRAALQLAVALADKISDPREGTLREQLDELLT